MAEARNSGLQCKALEAAFICSSLIELPGLDPCIKGFPLIRRLSAEDCVKMPCVLGAMYLTEIESS